MRQYDHKGRRNRDAAQAFRAQAQQSRKDKRREKGQAEEPEAFAATIPLPRINITVGWNVGWEEARPLPVLPVRHTTEPVLAYRAWRLAWVDGEPFLRSVTAGVTWESPTLRSIGKPPERLGSPGGLLYYRAYADGALVQNDWGIFCYRDPRAALSLPVMDVYGEIALMGRVIAHTHGYRAEMATIRRLVCAPRALIEGDPVAALERRYDCDVTTDFRSLLEASNGHR